MPWSAKDMSLVITRKRGSKPSIHKITVEADLEGTCAQLIRQNPLIGIARVEKHVSVLLKLAGLASISVISDVNKDPSFVNRECCSKDHETLFPVT